jgi:dihydroneopterin aldolase
MESMRIVALEGMEFFAYHGYYAEEQKTGNKYSVDIRVTSRIDATTPNDALDTTINYEVLYQLTSAAMKQPTQLLEQIARQILSGIRDRYPDIQQAEVAVSKFNPPIGGVCTKATVTLIG